jgi:hypothetical protein
LVKNGRAINIIHNSPSPTDQMIFNVPLSAGLPQNSHYVREGQLFVLQIRRHYFK